MFKLQADKRDDKAKGNQLRRQGLIPAVIFGKHLEQSILVQLKSLDAERFLRSNFIGAQAELQTGDDNHLVLLKNVSYTPGSNKLEHIDFQALKAGEKIRSTARIILLGRESIREGVFMQVLDDLSFTALPEDLEDRIEVDVSEMTEGSVLTVADLEFAKNENIELHTALDAVVATVTEARELIEEDEIDEDAELVDGEVAETEEGAEEAEAAETSEE